MCAFVCLRVCLFVRVCDLFVGLIVCLRACRVFDCLCVGLIVCLRACRLFDCLFVWRCVCVCASACLCVCVCVRVFV